MSLLIFVFPIGQCKLGYSINNFKNLCGLKNKRFTFFLATSSLKIGWRNCPCSYSGPKVMELLSLSLCSSSSKRQKNANFTLTLTDF